jgi:hypothetical protein
MSLLEYQDKFGNIVSIFDIERLEFIYSNWDLDGPVESLLVVVNREILDVQDKLCIFQRSHFEDHEIKKYLLEQSVYLIRLLNKFKKFLEEGASKNYRLFRSG